MSNLINLAEVLTPEACRAAKVGQTYGFEKGGKVTHYKVIRKGKGSKTVFAEKTKLYTQEEMKEKWEGMRSA